MLGSVVLALCLISSSLCEKKFPDGFLLGAGTSSFQIEGAWNEDGKGEGLWDRYLHDKNATENGDIACDSYHKWEEDVENIKKLGLDFYRFSISWPRILPDGTLNKINQKGVDYYMNLIKALKAENVEPMITIYHWDMPEHINELGGFLNPQFVDYFEDYARLLFTLYGEYVKYWFTLNEPTLICSGGYGNGFMAPGLKLIGDGIYQCDYVLIKAHARAYRVYEKEFKAKQKGQVGIVLSFQWAEPLTNSSLDLEAQERYNEFELGVYANPIFLGNWPQVMIDRIANRSALEGLSRSRLPQFTEEEIAYIKGTHDFFAVNTYGVGQVQYEPDPPISYPSAVFDESVGNAYSQDFYYPQGVRTMVKYINDKYKPNGIIITENGRGTEDTLDDQDRISLVRDYLSNWIDAVVEDGVNMIGYSIWALMDNFEWGTYEKRFGIIRVDFDDANRTRTWKSSAHWYQNLTTTRVLDV